MDSVVGLEVDKLILPSVAVLFLIVVHGEVGIAFLGLLVIGEDLFTIDKEMHDTATAATYTGENNRGTFGGSEGGTAHFVTGIDNRTVVGLFALNIDVDAVDGLGRTNKETNHRIVIGVVSEAGRTAISTVGRIVEVALILVGIVVVSIFGGSLVAGEADDGVVSVGTGGGSNTVGTGGLAGNCEVAVFLNAVTYTIGGVGGKSGLLGEGDDDGVVLAKFAIAIGVTANDGAVVNISSSDFFGVGTGDDGVEC